MKPFKHEIQKKKWDKLRRRKLITGIAIGGCSALVFAGAGVGVGYILFNKKVNPTPSPITNNDTITFSHYFASMTTGSQLISATSSEDKTVTLTADGDEQGTAWTFENNTLNYLIVNDKITVTITANDNVGTTNSINIDLLPQIKTSFNVSCTNPNLTYNTTDDLSLTWSSANYTPTTFDLKSDGSSDTNWTLTNDGNHQLTLARQSSSLPANVYNVVIVASDRTTTNEATVAVTVSNPVEKDLFFTTGDTTTTPDSTKAFYGTISAANFNLCDDANLKVQVNGAFPTGDDAWVDKTFDNQTHIKITPPSNLTTGSKFQVAIYDAQNDITSNAIGFSVQSKMNVEPDKYMTIDASGTVVIADVTETVSLASQNPRLVGLYFGSNSTVTTLDCYFNQLQQLDVSDNSQLQYLDCSSNQLTQLDVSNNSQLQTLVCESNQLTQLDVSNNSQLQTLDCSSNQLTQLDVFNNSQLQTLDCCSNQLTQLDVFNNSQLQDLRCYYNQLQQLDVSNNSQFQYLDCSFNQLQSLDVSNDTNLANLYCNYNQLTQLDVSSNSQLTILYCNFDQLTQLDVSGNSQLTTLKCFSTPLSLIKLPTNKSTGSFTFASSSTSAWTATDYAATGDIYCNSGLDIYGLPTSGWTRHNS